MIRNISLVGNKVVEEGLIAQRKFSTRWIHVSSPTQWEAQQLQKVLKVPFKSIDKPLRASRTLPEMEGIQGKSLFVLKVPGVSERGLYRVHELYVFLGKKEIITYAPNEHFWLKKLEPLSGENKKGILKRGATFILIDILDFILNAYFDLMSDLDEMNNKLEEEAIHRQAIIQTVFHLKRSLGFIHRSLNTNRNAVLSLQNGLIRYADPKLSAYFRNQYNDFMELIDLTSAYRDGLSSTLELYMSTVSNNLNVIMKRMTALGSVVLVPTLIAGIYGMNFEFQPEFGWKYGYVWALILMVLSVWILMWYFKKKEYL